VSKLHIAVLMGGWSAEREVSLMSGKGISEALESLGHRVTRIDMGHDVRNGPTRLREQPYEARYLEMVARGEYTPIPFASATQS